MRTPWYRKLVPTGAAPDLAALRAKAEQGDADAQFALGLNCGFRPGSERSDAEAAGWYRRAADQGHALAQFNLASMYAVGHGVAHDEAEAVRWYRQAAVQGDAGAQFQMGKRCQRLSFEVSNGDPGEARIEAYKWFNLASIQGYRDSEAYLERVNLTLTREEFDEGQRRAAAFRPMLTVE